MGGNVKGKSKFTTIITTDTAIQIQNQFESNDYKYYNDYSDYNDNNNYYDWRDSDLDLYLDGERFSELVTQ